MESVHSVLASLQHKDFLASMDIKDTYLHISYSQPHEPFLSFVVEDQHFQFVALPLAFPLLPSVHQGVGSSLGSPAYPEYSHCGIPGQTTAPGAVCSTAGVQNASDSRNSENIQVGHELSEIDLGSKALLEYLGLISANLGGVTSGSTEPLSALL